MSSLNYKILDDDGNDPIDEYMNKIFTNIIL